MLLVLINCFFGQWFAISTLAFLMTLLLLSFTALVGLSTNFLQILDRLNYWFVQSLSCNLVVLKSFNSPLKFKLFVSSPLTFHRFIGLQSSGTGVVV